MGNITIQKRGNVYQYKFEISSVNGKRKFINKSGFKTKSEAIKEGNKAFTEYQNAGIPFKECTMSYSDYLDYWIENYCRKNLKYNTIAYYSIIIEKYIKPNIGLYMMSSISSVTLNEFIIKICDEYDYSKSYLKNILKVLKGSFRDACNLFGLLKYDPARTIRLPKIEKEKKDIKHVYTNEEINKILKRFKNNESFTCSFLTACLTGMRTGEVFALTWDDIDLQNKTISVRKNVYDKPKDEKGRWYIGTPKTENGSRIIYISDLLVNILKNYKKKQLYCKKVYGDKYINYHLEDVKNEFGKVVEKRIVENTNNINRIDNLNFVFTKYNGKYVGTDLLKYPFTVIHKELGINCRFYDLRGSFATQILNNGIEIRDVADILGHRNIETTENYYISSTSDGRRKANSLMDEIIYTPLVEEISKFSINA